MAELAEVTGTAGEEDADVAEEPPHRRRMSMSWSSPRESTAMGKARHPPTDATDPPADVHRMDAHRALEDRDGEPGLSELPDEMVDPGLGPMPPGQVMGWDGRHPSWLPRGKRNQKPWGSVNAFAWSAALVLRLHHSVEPSCALSRLLHHHHLAARVRNKALQ